MKNTILTATMVLVLAFASAQGTKKGISYGVKGGLNLATLSGASSPKTLIGYQIGGFAEIRLGNKFALQPEIVYSTQGVKYDNFGTDFTFNLNYINIPIVAKYYIVDALSLDLGPQIGFLTAANFNGIDEKDSNKTIDFGFNAGAGYNVGKNIVVGLHYNLGLLGLHKNLPEGVKQVNNSVFQFSLGYKF